MAFTKTSVEVLFILLEKQGNANDASKSLLQISIMLLNVFCNSFSTSSSSVLEDTIVRKLPLNYWEQGRIQTVEIRAHKLLIWLNPCLQVPVDCIIYKNKPHFWKKGVSTDRQIFQLNWLPWILYCGSKTSN